MKIVVEETSLDERKKFYNEVLYILAYYEKRIKKIHIIKHIHY